MSKESWVARAIAWAEAGRLPDRVVRWGIRRLCRARLRREASSGCEAQQESLRQLLIDGRDGPLAPVPELANAQHYEVPAELYEAILGPRLKYSCCEWGDDVSTLAEAEERALATTARRAELFDGQTVLELGCGWGSLSLWMAEHYPRSRIVAVSNSTDQRRFIERRARERGLANIEVITRDINDFDATAGGTGKWVAEANGGFDRVVSVEMFEHVRDHRRLLERISHWLRPGGKLFVHVFCHRHFAYTFESDGAASWVASTFFSGGMMPNDAYFLRFQDHLRVRDQWRWSGSHYRRTAEAWLANLDHRRAEVRRVMSRTHGDEDADRWVRRWRLFLMSCAELWGFAGGDEWWVSHTLFEKPVSHRLDEATPSDLPAELNHPVEVAGARV
ncbi:MAG: class I SAM-dependent methyltransferase [Planctomycetes bacterium]|nr:class I SAM-dependent methyltransferase [Planctomycetota bacterium]